MKCFRRVLVCFLISGLIGCQSDRSVTITEYRPARPVVTERKAPDSEVFQLVRWQPIAPVITASTEPSVRPFKPQTQMQVEIEQVYAPRGTPIGFRRQDGQLIAFAGLHAETLEEGHYEWKTMKEHPNSARDKVERAFESVAIAAVLVAVLGLALNGYLRSNDCSCQNP